jgi:predicted HicB family RNase H-like nuclease
MAAKRNDGMSPLNARIPTDLHKHLRIEAINRGVRVQDLVAEALRKLLGQPSGERGGDPRLRGKR